MGQQRFEFGDRVHHGQKPEWGVGSVVKTEEISVNGHTTQRVSVRFTNAGLKVLSGVHADLVPAGQALEDTVLDEKPNVSEWDQMGESGWLGHMAERKVEELMISLPLEARDPFNGVRERLRQTLALYRFDRDGRSLVDWAVAQSGLDDPLSRFNRQELEILFDRWAMERDNHLTRLIDEARGEQGLVSSLLEAAPPAAQHAVRRVTAGR
ncbi:MAG: DUF3553 domain-containing protein [Planctomycetota bacterium]|jgi:hypothetical protein